jgi:hypothetical protein
VSGNRDAADLEVRERLRREPDGDPNPGSQLKREQRGR